MLRIAAEGDVSAMLAIYRPYVLTSTATFEYDPPDEEEFLRRYRAITVKFVVGGGRADSRLRLRKSALYPGGIRLVRRTDHLSLPSGAGKGHREGAVRRAGSDP